ncbi:MAG: hypothetical protein ACKO0Z_02290 [Betaproteobacteria bacterium]
MKGYTWVGNTRNTGQFPEELASIAKIDPRLHKHLTNFAEVEAMKCRRVRLHKNVRVKFALDAKDYKGKNIEPYGSWLSVWVHDKDMDTYNNNYMDMMCNGKEY